MEKPFLLAIASLFFNAALTFAHDGPEMSAFCSEFKEKKKKRMDIMSVLFESG